MSRERSGSLEFRGGQWHAKVTVSVGSPPRAVRRRIPLGTASRSEAARMLKQIVQLAEEGRLELDTAEQLRRIPTVADYATDWIARRKAERKAMAPNEQALLKHHVLDVIGRMRLDEVKSAHIRDVLDGVIRQGLKRGTVVQVRGVLHRLFADAWRVEFIDANPVARVPVPELREVKKERVILTDDEFARFIACGDVDLELRMLSLVSRVEGGMRAGDLNAWDWAMIDREHFAECTIPRSKNAKPQALTVPAALAPFLRAWWERAGKPDHGAVFPVRSGDRVGDFKVNSGGYAARLRRGLLRAKIFRLEPKEVVREYRRWRGTKTRTVVEIVPDERDPLYFETKTTLPVDFHSFRRAFNTALAEAGVNVQHAMHLADHSDPKVHQRYVMNTVAMRTLPEAAIPALPPASAIVPARDDSRGATSRNFGAGHGIRTRDIQLGNLRGDSRSAVVTRTSDAPSVADRAHASSGFSAHSGDSSRGDDSNDVTDHAIERSIVVAVQHGNMALAEELRAMLVRRRHDRASNVVEMRRDKR